MDLSEYAKALNFFIKDDAFNFRLQVEIGYRGVCDKMRDAVDLLSGNQHLHRFLISDIEKCFAKEEWSDPEQLSNAFAKLSGLMELQKQFELGLSFCLDDTTYPIAKARKYLAFMQHHPQFRSYIFQIGYGLMPVDKQGNLDYETVRQINDNDVDIEGQLAALQKENSGMSMLPFTWILSFEDLIYYDFFELVNRGLTVKKCKLCNRLFVLKSKHRAEYCDRKTENGHTCKQVGPKILFNAELEKAENAPLKEYDRIRKLKQQQLELDDPDLKKKRALLDKQGKYMYRINRLSWWKEELPSEEEYATARATLEACDWKVNYIFAHCTPNDVTTLLGGGMYKLDALTDFLEEVSQRCEFDYWFFGHHHENRNVFRKYVGLYEQIIEVVE